VCITAGRFEVSLPPGQFFGFGDVVLGDRAARLGSVETYQVETLSAIELRAEWAPVVVIHVVDAVFLTELSSVTIVRSADRPELHDYRSRLKLNGNLVVEDVPSPIELAPEDCGLGDSQHGVTLWACAPGYAWGSIEVQDGSSTLQTLALLPGSELEVILLNYDPTAGETQCGRDSADSTSDVSTQQQSIPDMPAILRLWKMQDDNSVVNEVASDLPSGEPILESRPHPSGVTVLTGLTPGPISVSIEIGRYWDENRILLGCGQAILKPGLRASVVIELDDAPVFRAIALLAGTLRLPPSWGVRNGILCLTPLELPNAGFDEGVEIPLVAMDLVDKDEGLYRWSAGTVVPGRYEASVSDFEYRQTFRVPPEGLLDAHVEIGEPSHVGDMTRSCG